VEQDTGGVAVHEFDEAKDGWEFGEENFPHAGSAPAVEGVFGVKGAVHVVWMDFKVGRNGSGDEFTPRRDSNSKLQRHGLQKEIDGIFVYGGKGQATEESEEDMANDNWAKGALLVLRNSNPAARIEKGDD
jgi:hypothetical protein